MKRRRAWNGRSAAAALVCAVALPLAQPERGGARIDEGRDALPSSPAGAVRALSWWGGPYAITGGETVRVYVSSFYPVEESRPRYWAEFLGSLPHGRELADLTMYVAPHDVVTRMCGADALGCYFQDDESLVATGDEVELPAPLTVEQVIEHEYGHHVLNHRSNAPWPAPEWGTKRWATYANVCRRVREGSAADTYDREPGEAFAESYRRLSDSLRGVPPLWPLVDPSFRPDARALELVRQDVVAPWRPVTVRKRRQLPAAGRASRQVVVTPLDGTVVVRAAARSRAARVEVTLGHATTGARLARGTGRAQATICGVRRVAVTIRTLAGAGAYMLTITRP